MALFGVRLSLASVAGLLMLIGYAVDTNILLTTHVLKRVSEQPREQVVDAMRTGLMMSGSTLVPLFALNLLTTAPQLYELTAVLIFGITIDIFNTWFLNASIISRYVEKRKGRGYYVGI
jgi:preprotein translocase subunit SecF